MGLGNMLGSLRQLLPKLSLHRDWGREVRELVAPNRESIVIILMSRCGNYGQESLHPETGSFLDSPFTTTASLSSNFSLSFPSLPTPQTPAPNFGISIAPHDDFLKETVFT